MAHGINPIIKRETDINNKACMAVAADLHHVHHHNHQHPAEHIMIGTSGANANAPHHPSTTTKMGSRRIFTPQFKLQVLDSYRNDSDCKGNQRATARKYGIHRRQIQKWLQCETNLRSSVSSGNNNNNNNSINNNNNNNNNNHNTSANKNGISEISSIGVHHHSSAATMLTTSPSNGHQQSHLSSNNNNNNTVSSDIGLVSLDMPSRHSVALNNNKSNTGFLSPVRSHSLEYAPAAFESQQQPSAHVVHSPSSASLPSCSPVFSNLVGNVGGASSSSGGGATPATPYDMHDYYSHYMVGPSQHHHKLHGSHDERLSGPAHHSVHYIDVGPAPQAVYAPYGYGMTPFVVNSISPPSPPPPPSSAIDLTVHGRTRDVSCERKAIIQMPATWHVPQRAATPPQQLPASVPDRVVVARIDNAWDLSARKRKCDANMKTKNDTEEVTPPKVIKLFKPYLLSDNDDDDDDDDTNEIDNADTEDSKKFSKHRQQHDPIIWSNYTTSLSSPGNFDPSNYSTSTMSCSPPITDLNNNNNNLAVTSSRCSTSLGSPHYDTTYHPMTSYGSPVSGYDTASSYSSSSECGDSMPPRSTSYALELKILAIDSYYNDQMCRGNEDAVADKYSIHRRQVQQWLMQEDHLRHQ